MKNKIIFKSLLLVALSFVLALFVYPMMPESMASHWGINGEVNGFLPKFWGVFLMPFISVIIFILLLFIPRLDPMKTNVDKFRKYFDNFILMILLFFFYIYALTIAWNLGYQFNLSQALVPAFILLFYYIGVLLEKSKRNWFIGIRTPWTLSSDTVWDTVHKKSGKLMKIFAILMLSGLIWPKYSFIIMFIPLILIFGYAIIDSYVLYKKEKKLNTLKK